MELLWKLINPNSNAPITGGAAGTAYKIRRGADGNLFDFDDMTFKASGWTTLSAALSEVDAAHLPGVYRGSIDTTLWQNGEYQFDATYSAGNVLLYATDRVALQDGVEAVTVGAVNDKTGYVLDSAYDAAKTAATQASVNALGSPMQASAYLAPDNAGIAAIQAKTDHLPSTPAATGDAMTLTGAYDAAKTAATQASVDAIHANVAVLTGGAGIFAVTIQVYRSGTTTPIADVSACVSDSNGDVTGFCQRSSAGGLCVFALNAGTYSLRLLKSGYQFAVVALTVTADLTQTVFGEPVAIPAPSDAESCVVYEYCFDAASQTPMSRVTATAAIISLPYNYAGRLHSCADVAGTYLATTGLLSWELARGAVVSFKIKEVGVARRVTIPNAATARLSDLR